MSLAPARTGDHPHIHGLLTAVFHGPSATEFQAQLDEPGYEASDRLVVKHEDDIAAHLRLASQSIYASSAAAPIVRFMDLATAPHFRSRGLATALLVAGAQTARQRGALFGLTRTRVPRLFARQGWSVCGSHFFSTAAPRSVLAELAAEQERSCQGRATCLFTPRPEPIDVRPLRRIEMPALVRLYDQHARGQSGWPVRTAEYWDWLLARGAFERIYIAATTHGARGFAQIEESIIGYAIAGRSRLIELVTAPGRDDVARRLVERVCGDAREQDGWLIRLDAPPRDPLHEVLRQAGGRTTASREVASEWFLAKVLNPQGALEALASTLTARAAAAGVSLPTDLGIELTGPADAASPNRNRTHFAIHLGETATHVSSAAATRQAITLAAPDLAPLLLGDTRAEALLAAGRLRATSAKAATLATALFPGSPWWRPPLDDLMA